MLLVCAGPDSFQALRKARELERAYRDKFDPSGISVEHVGGAKPLETLAERLGTVGLFAQRRCLRYTGLLASLKKADWDRAAKLFTRDSEQTIVITLEEDLPPDQERQIQDWERSKVYRFTSLSGIDFDRFAAILAQEAGIEYVPALQAFARSVEGDAWAFSNALPRWKATGTLPSGSMGEATVFAKTDEYLLAANSGRFQAFSDDGDLLPLLAQQSRQALRVFAHDPDVRMPAFAKRKWDHLTNAAQREVESRFKAVLEATVVQRAGSLQAQEAPLML